MADMKKVNDDLIIVNLYGKEAHTLWDVILQTVSIILSTLKSLISMVPNFFVIFL